MAVRPSFMNIPKPFSCSDCLKGFISQDKLNHHRHKLHGVPSTLKLSISTVSFLSPVSANNSPKVQLSDDTPTPFSLLQDGELTGMLQDLSKDPDTPIRGLLQEYQITPSVFDKDFRDSFAKVAQSTGKPRTRSSPRPPTLSRQNSQDVKTEVMINFSQEIVPLSPRTVFVGHLKSLGSLKTDDVKLSPVHTGFSNENLLQGGSLVGEGSHALSTTELYAKIQDLWAAANQHPYAMNGLSSQNGDSMEIGKNISSAKRKFDDMASETSESFSVSSSNASFATTSGRKTKPIQATDDPLLADKRRRNRVAAEKCRMKRKEKQKNLETENEELLERIKELGRQYEELTQCSQQVIQALQTDNVTLKMENHRLKVLVDGGITAVPVVTASANTSSLPPGGFSLILKSQLPSAY